MQFWHVSDHYLMIAMRFSFIEVFMEYLEIRDQEGNPTGIIKERSKIHEDVDLHGTSHVFIARRNPDHSVDLLLQKRAMDKDSYPGCYDISSAGHIPAGQDYLKSALRELKEELGITISAEELHYLGIHRGYSENIFYDKMFKNNEVSKVYLITKTISIPDLSLQKEEIDSVKWMNLDQTIQAVRDRNPNYCLFEDELLMVKKAMETLTK